MYADVANNNNNKNSNNNNKSKSKSKNNKSRYTYNFNKFSLLLLKRITSSSEVSPIPLALDILPLSGVSIVTHCYTVTINVQRSIVVGYHALLKYARLLHEYAEVQHENLSRYIVVFTADVTSRLGLLGAADIF